MKVSDPERRMDRRDSEQQPERRSSAHSTTRLRDCVCVKHLAENTSDRLTYLVLCKIITPHYKRWKIHDKIKRSYIVILSSNCKSSIKLILTLL